MVRLTPMPAGAAALTSLAVLGLATSLLSTSSGPSSSSLLSSSPFLLFAHAKPLLARAKDWDAVDWDAAEKQLEEGDDPELLVTEEQETIAAIEARKRAGIVQPDDSVKLKDPSEWVKHTSAMSGPTMIFITLDDAKGAGAKAEGGWANAPKKDVEELTSRWRDLLKTDGIDALCYEIGNASILVSLQSGWRGYDVRDFLLAQPEVKEIEWDAVKYRPGDELPARPSDLNMGQGLGSMMGGRGGGMGGAAKGKKGAKKRTAKGAAGGAAGGIPLNGFVGPDGTVVVPPPFEGADPQQQQGAAGAKGKAKPKAK